jgi:YidC/Oxa1 family membrane protein insertase
LQPNLRERYMERNHIIGFILIFATLLTFNILTSPSKEELAKRQMEKDSIESLTQKKLPTTKIIDTVEASKTYGALAPLALQKDSIISLENDVMKVNFSAKGGKIASVVLKNYKKTQAVNGIDSQSQVLLLEDKKNIYNLTIPTKSGTIATKDLVFTPTVNGNKVDFLLTIDSTSKIVQSYTLSPKGNSIDYTVSTPGMTEGDVKIEWVNFIDKIEKGYRYEQQNTSIYFNKTAENKTDYCKCAANDSKDLNGIKIDWVANTNQFFNSTLMSQSGGFKGATLSTELFDFTTNEDLKKYTSIINVPISGGIHKMQWYIGPNDFNTLRKYGNKFEEIIPYGSSIFGTLNRWVIRPFFEFLNGIISSKGISIILAIFLIKMMLYPLLYKMLHSQAKMAALKPELTKLKEKFKDDTQKQQVESMKVYQEFGVSPFAGCLPMFLQMPIWIALYRFFPSNITFRQERFLWAPDLSSFDSFFNLPFEIPFMGAHISLFTLLWAISTVIYTYYSTKDVDMSANPAMKYVQYFMPLMFLGFFNSYASGLTCYMFFSNLINILQTILTKKYVFDDSKIRKELEKQKAAPKKKGGFQERLQEAMKQQQKLTEEKSKTKK